MPSSASHNRDGFQQQEHLTEELNELGLEIKTKLGVSNLSRNHIHDLMQHLNYLAGGCYNGADFSYNSYIRDRVQIVSVLFSPHSALHLFISCVYSVISFTASSSV
jgi:hypothetical protein